MATLGYTIMDNLYILASDFDMPVSMVLGDMANFADQVEKNLNDGVSRSLDEVLSVYKARLDDYAVSAKNSGMLTDSELDTVREVIVLALDV